MISLPPPKTKYVYYKPTKRDLDKTFDDWFKQKGDNEPCILRFKVCERSRSGLNFDEDLGEIEIAALIEKTIGSSTWLKIKIFPSNMDRGSFERANHHIYANEYSTFEKKLINILIEQIICLPKKIKGTKNFLGFLLAKKGTSIHSYMVDSISSKRILDYETFLSEIPGLKDSLEQAGLGTQLRRLIKIKHLKERTATNE